MARYELSEYGADNLFKISEDLNAAYSHIMDSTETLEAYISALQNNHAEIYENIVELATSNIKDIRDQKDNILLLSKNLRMLATRILEILGKTQEAGTSEGNRGWGESDTEKATMDSFMDGIFNKKNIKLEEPDGGAYMTWVDANNVVGVLHNSDISESDFWTHHSANGESRKDMFRSMASQIDIVRDRINQGVALDEIKKDPSLRACAEQYLSLIHI